MLRPSVTSRTFRRRTAGGLLACLTGLVALAGVAAAPPAGATPNPFGVRLLPGEVLRSGQGIATGVGTSLYMQPSGNLEVVDHSGRFGVGLDGATPTPYVVWSSRTAGNPGASAVLQTDGNLVVYSAAGRPLWWSGTAGRSATELVMQPDDGNLVLYGRSGPLWFTGVPVGPDRWHGPGLVRQLTSANRRFVVSSSALGPSAWEPAAPTNRDYWGVRCFPERPACGPLVVQPDGNLVLYPERGGPAIWSSGTAGAGPDVTLVIQDDSNVVLYGPRGPLWQSGTRDGTYRNPL